MHQSQKDSESERELERAWKRESKQKREIVRVQASEHERGLERKNEKERD